MKPGVALKPHLSVEQIKECLYQSKNGRHASYWQIILTMSLNPEKPPKTTVLTWASPIQNYTALLLFIMSREKAFVKLCNGEDEESHVV